MAEQGDLPDQSDTTNHTNILSSLSGESLEKARLELNEDPSTRGEAIQELKQKICSWKPSRNEEKSLVLANTNEKFLLMFLRGGKFDLEKAFQLYVNYHLFRHKHSDMLSDLNFKSLEHVLHTQVIRVLGGRFQDGSKAICITPGNWDCENIPFVDNFRATLLILDKLIQDEETQVNGFSVIYDFTDSSFMSMLKVAKSELITKGVLIELLQEAFPGRFKGVHLMFQPWYISIVLSVIKPFMKQKLRDRIHGHGEEFESLHRFIDPQSLCMELGGELQSDNATVEMFEQT